ncbi:MAG: GreA/GreB family elongation factor [Clostridia bacterium]|nr:GreA/GreB family elongation factor [Clostridia bacterium]
MARGFEVSKTLFENLVKHLVEVEEQKDKLLGEYFQEPSKERDELEKLIDNYIKHIESLIKQANKSDTAGASLPFVTIGSEVEIQDLSTQEVHRFRLVAPFSTSVGGGDISYISPVGKALLLKRVGDEVTVNAPAGVFRYKIKSIKWRGD